MDQQQHQQHQQQAVRDDQVHPANGTSASTTVTSRTPNAGLLLPLQRKSFLQLTSGEILDILEVLKRAGRLFGRTFVVSLLAKSTLKLLTSLLKGKKLKSSQVVDWRFGLFLGSLSGSFKAIHGILKVIRRKDDVIGSAISGGVAGLSLLCLPREDRTTWCLYLLVRSGEFLAKVLAKQGKIPSLLANFPHWDVLLMCLTAAQILFAFIYERHTLDPSYQKFLKVHGGKPTAVIYTVRNLHYKKLPDIPALQKVFPTLPIEQIIATSAKAVAEGKENPLQVACKLSHPGMNCFELAVRFFIEGFRRAIFVYVPIHGIYSLIVLYNKLAVLRKARGAKRSTTGNNNDMSQNSSEIVIENKPLYAFQQTVEVLRRFIQNVARSSAFLSLYCTLGWGSTCYASQHYEMPNGPWLISRLMLASGGLSVLVEAKARRMELALYCAPYALESAWRQLVEAGYVKNIPNAILGLFCLATATIAATFNHQREVIKPSIRSVLEWLWGR
eukprot:TRINITY_DN51_c0_g7_i1.p1 TRINITY_DN51_c0_g7~~TRINITY_DN51_c0_g7_i1.p1  ORF type:complete len:500 (-),score=110.61 TRINITY_DN51_c0_g7_i1:100-1599(-)